MFANLSFLHHLRRIYHKESAQSCSAGLFPQLAAHGFSTEPLVNLSDGAFRKSFHQLSQTFHHPGSCKRRCLTFITNKLAAGKEASVAPNPCTTFQKKIKSLINVCSLSARCKPSKSMLVATLLMCEEEPNALHHLGYTTTSIIHDSSLLREIIGLRLSKDGGSGGESHPPHLTSLMAERHQPRPWPC